MVIAISQLKGQHFIVLTQASVQRFINIVTVVWKVNLDNNCLFLHSRLLFVKVFTLCGAILRIVIMFSCRLFYRPMYACYRHFLRVGAPVFLVCSCMFYVHCICIHGLRACY